MIFRKQPISIEDERRLREFNYQGTDSPEYNDIIQQEADAQDYELPSDLKEHAYNIFPSLNEVAPNSNIQIPYAPEEQPVEEQPAQEAAQAAPEQQAIQKPEPQAPIAHQAQPASQPVQPQNRAPAVVEEAPQDEVKQAMQQADQNAYNAMIAGQIARTRDAIIGAGSGNIFKADNSIYDDMKAQADKPVKNLLLAAELQNNQAKNDPKSQISQLVRKSLEEMGMSMAGLENVSYSQIEKLYPSLAQALYTKIANDAKREERQLASQIKEDNKETQTYNKTRDIVNNKVSKLMDSKTSPFYIYDQSKQTSQMIDNAIASWDNQDQNAKMKNSVAFMQYAKIAQGDDSVVRSSDMQALAGGLNYSSPQALLSKFAARAEGSPFSKGELVEMKKIIDTVRKVKKEQIRQRLDPIIKTAEHGGYDLDQSISQDIINEIYSPEPETVLDKAKRLQELRMKANQGK